MEVYVGKQPPDPYENQVNSGLAIAERMCQPIYGTNRNVTTDNWITSIPLCEKLLNNRKTTLLGTLKKNKPQLTIIMKGGKYRQIPSSIFAFKKDVALVSHIPKQTKQVLLISSMHDDAEEDEETLKPEMIL